MKFFVVVNGKKLKRSAILLMTALFTATILYMSNLQIAVFSTEDGPKAFYKGDEESKHVSLTFNLNWGDEKAIPLLDVLKSSGVKNTTFFISGSWAERHPEIVQRIIDDGHEIGSLGYDYQNYTDLDEKKINRDLALAKEAFNKLKIKDIELMRTPTGKISKEVIEVAERHGYTLVHWSVDSKDYMNPGVEQIVNRVLVDMKGGDIILLHASDSAKQTIKVMPLIIKGMKQNGYTNIPVSELIANAKASSKEVQ
ncbi:polysaccharide deacetylase family sporulation protein PdaB [Bacillus solimangrovi]|uniref:Polysaccharide deacetylase family sporulation protein PdaB n=1 Tax=Bacillus solimangrovi TaxID=1305675 RepID=A0A1E5LGM5_9BACI|nr:polysaccharide deacetylase family sporulation protein PdaB [Bacillus solimangrovi]OEH93229.1 polysaccharide deacetylase family sporulation protein PdaB [Bacillus solimangrovi]